MSCRPCLPGATASWGIWRFFLRRESTYIFPSADHQRGKDGETTTVPLATTPSMEYPPPQFAGSACSDYPQAWIGAGINILCPVPGCRPHTILVCPLLYLQPPSSVVIAPTGARCNICISWNKAACIFPSNCSMCATCQLLHKGRDCPQTPDSSVIKKQHSTGQ